MSRTDTAIQTLVAGGYFRKQLETQWKGGEKFVTRLRDRAGHVVKGVGIKTFFELQDAGKLQHRDCASSSVWPQEWAWSDRATVGLNRLIREQRETGSNA